MAVIIDVGGFLLILLIPRIAMLWYFAFAKCKTGHLRKCVCNPRNLKWKLKMTMRIKMKNENANENEK
jgi:hypothetical protein